jgi:ABC-type branched-subunit amino acid transport system substrate-binding protein
VKLRMALAAVALITMGCASPGGLKTEATRPTALAAPPASPGPQAPTLADVHSPVSDLDYQAAVSDAGPSEPNRHNLQDFEVIGQYQYNHADYAGALKTYQQLLSVPALVPQLDRAQYMVGQVYYDKKDYLPALAAFQNVLQKYPQSPFAGQGRQMMQFILGYSMDMDGLKSFVANYPDSPMNCYGLFQLGSRESQAGMPTEAMDHLRAYAQQCPQDASAGAAQLLLQSLQNQTQGKTWKIGVFVPLTGKFKSYGQSVLNGVMLARDEANLAGGSRKALSVVVEDTGSEGIKAAALFEALTKDDGLDAIIGPVAPTDIQAIATLANEHKITLLCPATSHDGLSTLGPYVFSNCMTNEMQGRVMAKYAVEHLGLKRFGIMAPEDAEGQARADAFQKMVESIGGTVNAYTTYTPYAADFKKQIMDLGGQDPEASKENDRENVRRIEELKYNIKKEVGKILLKAKDAGFDPSAQGAGGIAAVPCVEALTNTSCPTVVKDVDQAVRDAFRDQELAIRSEDLVQQALTRLPAEAKGNTLPVSAAQWQDVAADLQASLLVTGKIVETDPPGDWSMKPNWNIAVDFTAYLQDASGKLTVLYQSQPDLAYKPLKPTSLLRVNSNIQGLYLPAHPQEIPLIVSQVHFYDLNPVFLGSHTWLEGTLLQDAGKDVEGSYFTTGFYDQDQGGTAKKFTEDYLRKFALRPDLLSAQAFDATRLLFKAMDTAATREDIRTNLLQIKDFDGVTGKTSFEGHGEADKMVPILKIQDGKYQQVQ